MEVPKYGKERRRADRPTRVAGPEEWVQLDTSGNINPADMKWVLRTPVCLDAGCSRSLMTYTVHMYPEAATDAGDYAVAARQASQALSFLRVRSGDQPHAILGDFNALEGTATICTQKPQNEPVEMFRTAGYLDAWPAIHGETDGSTGMWNRVKCGVPEGNLFKRIDYSWSKALNPIAMARGPG